VQNAERSWALGVMRICQYPEKINDREVGRPPEAVKSILYIRYGVRILAGDGINAPIVYAKTIRTVRLLGKADRGGPVRVRGLNNISS